MPKNQNFKIRVDFLGDHAKGAYRVVLDLWLNLCSCPSLEESSLKKRLFAPLRGTPRGQWVSCGLLLGTLLFAPWAAADSIRTWNNPGGGGFTVNGNPRIGFRVSKSELIPFARIPFPLNAIKEVLLGPKQDSQYARDTTATLLASAGFDPGQVKIASSGITYR